MSGPYPLSMYGEPDTNKIKETFSYYRFKCELQPPLLKNIEPAEMIPARYTLTLSSTEKFTHPPSDAEDTSDSEDTTDSEFYADMPELVDPEAEPFPRSERNYDYFRFLRELNKRSLIRGAPVGRSARMKKKKRGSMSTGGKNIREGHIECSKVLCRPDAVRPLVCTLKRDSDGAQIARPLGWNQGCGGSMICQTNDVGLHKEVRSFFINYIRQQWIENVTNIGLPSNHRGRGVCPCELGHRQRDLQEISEIPFERFQRRWGEHMTWDMLPRLGSIKYREKHDRMIQDVWQPVAHINLANTITT